MHDIIDSRSSGTMWAIRQILAAALIQPCLMCIQEYFLSQLLAGFVTFQTPGPQFHTEVSFLASEC